METAHQFWHKLAKCSEQFTTPVSVDSPFRIAAATLEEIRDLFFQLAIGPRQVSHDRTRIFIDGVRRKYEYEQAFFDAVSGTDALVPQLEKHFGDHEFLIFVNGAGSWSEPLQRRFAKVIEPLLKTYPIPRVSFELHVIAGRYRTTPFGIHLDEPNDRVLHFNLGPGTKQLHLWDKSNYAEKTGGDRRTFKVGPLFDSAMTYELPAGSVFLLPSEIYHIGSSPRISISVALAITKETRKSFRKSVLSQLGFDLEKADFGAEVNPYTFDSEEVCPAFGNECWPGSATVASWVTRAVDLAVLHAESNLGFMERPCPLTEAAAQLETHKTLCVVRPFPLRYHPAGESLYLFVRGYRVTLKYVAAFVDVLEELTDAGHLPLEQALASLERELTREAAINLLGFLVRYGGCEVCDVDG